MGGWEKEVEEVADISRKARCLFQRDQFGQARPVEGRSPRWWWVDETAPRGPGHRSRQEAWCGRSGERWWWSELFIERPQTG